MSDITATWGADFALSERPPRNERFDVESIRPLRGRKRQSVADALYLTALAVALAASDVYSDDAMRQSWSATKGEDIGTLPAVQADRNAELSAEIFAYENLPIGWDGPESVPPSRAAIEDAIAFIELLPLKVNLDPMVSADGEVGFYKRTPESYIDIGFRGDGKISYFAKAGELRAKGTHPFGRHSLPKDLLEAISVA